jgi:hypothetical protein
VLVSAAKFALRAFRLQGENNCRDVGEEDESKRANEQQQPVATTTNNTQWPKVNTATANKTATNTTRCWLATAAAAVASAAGS